MSDSSHHVKHVVIDGGRNRVSCLNCGESIPHPFGTVDFTVAVIDAFIAAHAACGKGARRSVPLCAFASPPPEART